MDITPADNNTAGLPEGWALTKLLDACEINPPKASKDSLSPDDPVTFVPMPAVDAEEGAITKPQTRRFSEVRKGFTSFRENDVIMAKITPCMENGKAAIARNLINGLGFGSTEFHVIRSSGVVLPEFIYHLIRQRSYRRAAEAEMIGSVGQKRVPQWFLEETELPLPPLSEQIRVVRKLTELSNTLKLLDERLCRVPAILKRFREAVLASACSGKLTEDWRLRNAKVEPAAAELKRILGVREEQKKARYRCRKEHKSRNTESPPPDLGFLYEMPDTWVSASVGQVFLLKSGEAFKAIDYAEDGLRLFQIANVGFGRTLWEQRNFLPAHFANDFPELILEEGDICIALNRPILGNDLKVTRIGTGDLPAILYQRVGLLRAVESSSADFGFLYFQSPFFRDLVRENLQGTDQPYLNFSLLPRFVFPFPPAAEMEEIARRVKSLFSLADAIEQRIALSARCTEKITQSILAKAFRGELVPTEAELARSEGREYESASVLLERIKTAKASLDSQKALRSKRPALRGGKRRTVPASPRD